MSKPCTMGVGCDEYGVCYAAAMGAPDRCPVVDDYDWADDARKSYDEAIRIKRERGDIHYVDRDGKRFDPATRCLR